MSKLKSLKVNQETMYVKDREVTITSTEKHIVWKLFFDTNLQNSVTP